MSFFGVPSLYNPNVFQFHQGAALAQQGYMFGNPMAVAYGTAMMRDAEVKEIWSQQSAWQMQMNSILDQACDCDASDTSAKKKLTTLAKTAWAQVPSNYKTEMKGWAKGVAMEGAKWILHAMHL